MGVREGGYLVKTSGRVQIGFRIPAQEPNARRKEKPRIDTDETRIKACVIVTRSVSESINKSLAYAAGYNHNRQPDPDLFFSMVLSVLHPCQSVASSFALRIEWGCVIS